VKAGYRRAQPFTFQGVTLDVARLAFMLVVTVLLQATLAPHVRILGASPDFTLIAVVCVGLLRGSEIGALFGFIAGLCVAVAVFGPLGLNSLVLVVVGYVAGRYAETADTSSGLAPIFVVAVSTALAEIMYTLSQFLLDRQAPFGFFFVHALLPVLVLNTLLAAPGYLVARLWLREGMGDASRPA
jgi:rod shape-determining protein MreD